MSSPVERFVVYLELARVSELRASPFVSDKLLLLATLIAQDAGWPCAANCCRRRILRHNPQHWIGKYPGVAQAAADPEFMHFVGLASRHYPPEKAERLMQELSIDLAERRAEFPTLRDYIASLAQASRSEIDDAFDALDNVWSDDNG